LTRRERFIETLGLLLLSVGLSAGVALGAPSTCYTANSDMSRTYYDCVTGAVLCTCPSWDATCATVACTSPDTTTSGTTTTASGGYRYNIRVVPSATFLATGGSSGTATCWVTDAQTGMGLNGAFVHWKMNQWTYKSADNNTDYQGKASFNFGHVRPVTCQIWVDVAAAANALGDPKYGEGPTIGTSQIVTSQGSDSASGPNGIAFLSPLAGASYTCRPSSPSTDYLNFTVQWNTYKWSPAGYRVTVAGPSTSGIYWSLDSAPQSSQAGSSFNACQFTPGTARMTATLYIRYYTINGMADYATAAAYSNTLTIH
jgi:hypothetical protein